VITSAGPYSLQKGKTLSNVLIATVTDAEDSAASLLVDKESSWNYVGEPNLLTNIVNTNGQVTASIGAACRGGIGDNVLGLNVFDTQFAVGLGNLTVHIVPNPKPNLGTYPMQ
jgi:hypothetical protein